MCLRKFAGQEVRKIHYAPIELGVEVNVFLVTKYSEVQTSFFQDGGKM